MQGMSGLTSVFSAKTFEKTKKISKNLFHFLIYVLSSYQAEAKHKIRNQKTF